MEKRKLTTTEKLLLMATIVFALVVYHEWILAGIGGIMWGVDDFFGGIEYKKTSYDSVIDLKESKTLASEIKDIFPSNNILYKICADDEEGQTTTSVYVRYRNVTNYLSQEELSALYTFILGIQDILNSHIDYQTCQQSDYMEVVITNRSNQAMPEETLFRFKLYKGTDGHFKVYAVQEWNGECDLFVLTEPMDVKVLYCACSANDAEDWDEEQFLQLAHLEKLYLVIYTGSYFDAVIHESTDEDLKQFIENSLPDCEIIWGKWWNNSW